MSHPRRGFALLAALVTVAAVFIIAVAATTGAAIVSDHRRVEYAARVIIQLMDSSRFSITRFQADVGEYPGRLRQLRRALLGTDRDICNATYSATEQDEWGAPYIVREIGTTGLWTGIGMARDSLGKDPLAGTPTAGTPHALVLIIDDVDEQDARSLNTMVDPETEATPNTLGRVRWGSPDAEGQVVLQFRKDITQC